MAVGASGVAYDQLALPVRRRILFAGEHTCKEHPDTVGGAMLTGVWPLDPDFRAVHRRIYACKAGIANAYPYTIGVAYKIDFFRRSLSCKSCPHVCPVLSVPQTLDF